MRTRPQYGIHSWFIPVSSLDPANGEQIDKQIQGKKLMEYGDKIYIAGHRGLVGSALLRALKQRGYRNLLTCTHTELDLTRQEAVERFFQSERPEYVFLAAATKAKTKLGWTPRIKFKELVQEMVKEDLHQAQRDALCQRERFRVYNHYD